MVLINGGKTFKGHYGGGPIPRLFLLDREGKIAYTHLGWGAGDQKELEQQVEKLLKS